MGQQPGAADFGEAPVHHPAGQVHLPQAVLGMDEPQGDVGILLACGADMGNAVAVTMDVHRGAEAGNGYLALGLRKRGPEPQVKPRAGGGQQNRNAETKKKQHAP